MKTLLVLLIALSSGAVMAKTPAEVLRVDFTGFTFMNFCSLEPVAVDGGDLLIVLRRDYGGDVNGVHLVNKVAGHFQATGLHSGGEYLVNVTAPSSFLPISNNNINPVNGAGMVNLVSNVEIINLSEPGTGVSKVKALIVTVLGDVPDTKVLDVSYECIGR